MVGDRVECRRYEDDDLDAVLALCRDEGWTTYVEDPARARRVFEAPGVVAVVATVDGDVAGFAYCQSDGAIQAHLSLLVIDKGRRRRGLARLLVAYAFTLVGAARIDLITDSAGAFYRSLAHKEQVGFRLYPH
jgi:GNAT superfamily N-acetyltransferase